MVAERPAAAPVETPSTADVAALLAARGYRSTRPRRAVLDAVLGRTRPFTAEQVVADLKRNDPQIGRATVYRTLEILAAVGVLARVVREDAHPAYIVGLPDRRHHHHLVCSDCGAAVAFTACPVDDLVRDLSQETDFAIHGHRLEVFGTCGRCRDAGRVVPVAPGV